MQEKYNEAIRELIFSLMENERIVNHLIHTSKMLKMAIQKRDFTVAEQSQWETESISNSLLEMKKVLNKSILFILRKKKIITASNLCCPRRPGA